MIRVWAPALAAAQLREGHPFQYARVQCHHCVGTRIRIFIISDEDDGFSMNVRDCDGCDNKYLLQTDEDKLFATYLLMSRNCFVVRQPRIAKGN